MSESAANPEKLCDIVAKPFFGVLRMPRPRNTFPTYRRHSNRDQAFADVFRHDGKRTKVYFPGPFGSAESKAAYQRLLKQLKAHGGKLPPRMGESLPDDLTIDEVVARFMKQKVAVDYVDANGDPTTERYCFRGAQTADAPVRLGHRPRIRWGRSGSRSRSDGDGRLAERRRTGAARKAKAAPRVESRQHQQNGIAHSLDVPLGHPQENRS
jgi:hypothetical protein